MLTRGIEPFHRSRRIRRCGLFGVGDLVEGSVSLRVGFEISNAHARPTALCLAMDQDAALSYFSSTSLPAAMLPATMLPAMVITD